VSKAIVDGLLAKGPTATQLNQLEMDAFSHTYSSNTNEERICRIEHFVFGKQSTGDLLGRYNRLRKALTPKSADAITAPSLSASPNSGTIFGASESPRKTYDFPTLNKKEIAPAPVETKRPTGLIDLMNHGIDNYNAHKYAYAEDDFEECCAMAPGMSRCFTYLAITKMQLNYRQAAIDAFRTSFMLDPFGTYGRYAKSCLVVLAGDEAMRKRPPVDSKQVLDVALNNIDKQSSDLSSRHRSAADQIANSRIGYRYGYSQLDARIQSNNAQIEGTLRSAHTIESANNLKHMLAVKRMPGDANLRAWGTTLTTRYYGNETYLNAPYYIPKERPMELKAIEQSLQSAKAKAAPSAAHGHSRSAHVKAHPHH
jgi:hypothetical protein